MTEAPKLRVFFFLDNKEHAVRFLRYVPIPGDEVGLDDGYYLVKRRVWQLQTPSGPYQPVPEIRVNLEIERIP